MSDKLFDNAVRDWLEDGSDRTPPSAIDAVLLAVKTTPQERDLRIPRRFTLMPTYMRLAAGIAIVAVLGVVALSTFTTGPGPGSRATPSPAASPTFAPSPTLPPIDTSAWISFVSDRYGFSIKHPAEWTEVTSDHAFVFANDFEAWQSTGVDSFFNKGVGLDMGVKVSVWSVKAAPAVTAQSWLQTWCDATSGGNCAGLSDELVTVETADGKAGVMKDVGDTMAVFLDAGTIYVVGIWRTETDPSVMVYGGARRLLDAYLSTFTLPAQPAPSPTAS